ncbi:kappaPI-stichotoxin-Shd2a-like [Dermacentor silvarum]|uniref:kappaPI-stichotoxin-Shd2a-like n=1 Tax=Dermacentor silvarum TaxID=543639 RepID=UPI002100D25C|nr:kappaPI-stichotoxin-Shd2a-like [Dermacentor silvarum]
MKWGVCIFLLFLVIVPCQMRKAECSLPKDIGNCKVGWNLSYQWYFDPGMSACRPFLYGGCGGNKNRFASCELCNSACETSVCAKEKPGPSPFSRSRKHHKRHRFHRRRYQDYDSAE